MKDLWKGIAIAGIWIGLGLSYLAISYYATNAKNPIPQNPSALIWVVLALTILVLLAG